MSRQSRSAGGSTRRRFLQTSGLVAGGIAASNAARAEPSQTLALNGGPKAVTAPHGDAARWPLYGKEEEKAVLELVRNPSYEPERRAGAGVAALIFRVPYAKAYCNGTSALTSMFFALNLPPGSEIMVPSYTFFATIVPMRLFGLVPVFVDINPRTLNFDLEDAKKRADARTPRPCCRCTGSGCPADMDHICDWAKEKGLIVLEDCLPRARGLAQGQATWAPGARWRPSASRQPSRCPASKAAWPSTRSASTTSAARPSAITTCPSSFPEDSPYQQVRRSPGLGLKLRMHPMAAALARVPAQGPRASATRTGAAQVRPLNDRLVQLPGLYEQKTPARHASGSTMPGTCCSSTRRRPACRARRASRPCRPKASRPRRTRYPLQHKLALYREAQWWHHLPTIPELPGSRAGQRHGDRAAVLHRGPVPELVDQYVKAFEKVWAHRKSLKL